MKKRILGIAMMLVTSFIASVNGSVRTESGVASTNEIVIFVINSHAIKVGTTWDYPYVYPTGYNAVSFSYVGDSYKYINFDLINSYDGHLLVTGTAEGVGAIHAEAVQAEELVGRNVSSVTDDLVIEVLK